MFDCQPGILKKSKIKRNMVVWRNSFHRSVPIPKRFLDSSTKTALRPKFFTDFPAARKQRDPRIAWTLSLPWCAGHGLCNRRSKRKATIKCKSRPRFSNTFTWVKANGTWNYMFQASGIGQLCWRLQTHTQTTTNTTVLHLYRINIYIYMYHIANFLLWQLSGTPRFCRVTSTESVRMQVRSWKSAGVGLTSSNSGTRPFRSIIFVIYWSYSHHAKLSRTSRSSTPHVKPMETNWDKTLQLDSRIYPHLVESVPFLVEAQSIASLGCRPRVTQWTDVDTQKNRNQTRINMKK